MGEKISSFTTAVVNAPGKLEGALAPILSRHHITPVFFADVYCLAASVIKLSGNTESILVIGTLQEFEKEDFTVVKLIREHFTKSCFICIDDSLNGNLERVLQAMKAGAEIVTSAEIAEGIIARFKDDPQVKEGGNNVDILKVENFEKRMSSMMGAFFLTSAEQKALSTQVE